MLTDREPAAGQCVVEEAYFAEVNGAHDVISATITADVARRLAPWLDLPGQLPPGLTLGSFISGFPFEGHYVLARTSLDATASRRGMVFTHAVLLPLAVTSRLETVAPLLNRLHSQRPQVITAQQSALTLKGAPPPRPPQLAAVAQHLVNVQQRPAVIADLAAFEAVVVGLWAYLPGALRQRLVFGLSFAPEDCAERHPHLIATLPSLTSRWPDEMVASNQPRPPSAVGALLAGEVKPDIAQFLGQLDREFPSFDDLSKVDRLWSRLNASPTTFSSLLSAARLLSIMQPDIQKARALKGEVMKRLCSEPMMVGHLRQLRNFETDAFPSGEALWRAASEAMRVALCGGHPADAIDLLDAASSSQPSAGWKGAYANSLLDLRAGDRGGLAQTVWHVLGQRPDLFVELAKRCPPAAQFDRLLADALPSVAKPPSWDEARDALMRVDWPLAEVALLIRHHQENYETALELLCARSGVREATIDFVLAHMSDAEIVRAALHLSHRTVSHRAVDVLAASPHVLAETDLSSTAAQELWAEAIALNGEAWNIGQDAGQRWFALLTQLVIDQEKVDQQLLERLSDTPLANLLDHSSRREIWQALPERCASAYAMATARAWITRSTSAEMLPAEPVEEPLGKVIASPACRDELLRALGRAPFGRVVGMFTAVPWLDEETCKRVFLAAVRAQYIAVADAEAAGQLLANRRWTTVVKGLYDSIGIRTDLRPLFVICADSLSFYDRWMSGLSRPTNSDLHQMLADLVVELYPYGPDSQGLWERAGGDVSDLAREGSGRVQWADAIRRVRSGGRPRPRSLIEAMLDDFPHNEKLRYLKKQGLF